MIWKPIETAPKDGRYVLLFCPEAFRTGYDRTVPEREWGMIVGMWDDDADAWESIDDCYYPEGVSHWMPLPSPPNAAR